MLLHTFDSEVLIQRWNVRPQIPNDTAIMTVCTSIFAILLIFLLSAFVFTSYSVELFCIQLTVIILISLILYAIHLAARWASLGVLVAEQVSIISDTLRIARRKERIERRDQHRRVSPPTTERQPVETPKPGGSGFLEVDMSKLNNVFSNARWN